MQSAHLSVSPYTTLPPQRGVLLTSCIALFSVSLALLMMLSLIYSTMMTEEKVYGVQVYSLTSTQGILPEKLAAV